MKPIARNLTLIAALAILGIASAGAQLDIPSDGSDGVFNPSESIEVDLSQAVTGNWDDDNTSNAGKGIYDPEQWAVVFKYQSVTIPAGVTVSFKNHPSRAPVVWLVQGDVMIVGPGNDAGAEPALNLNGEDGVPGNASGIPREPGPGGFRGGVFNLSDSGSSYGPGAPVGGTGSGVYLGRYGNPRIIPLIGGSGAAAYGSGDRTNGGGGGAIFIGCSGDVTLDGKIHANGGLGIRYLASGGAVKVVANRILGTGEIRATYKGDSTVPGRIRLETNSFSSDIATDPETLPVTPDPAPFIWPPSNAPKVRILSVDGVSTPEEPTANLTTGADIGIQNDGAVDILVETTNFPIEGIVQVRVAPKYSGRNTIWGTATYQSGNNARAIWKLSTGFAGGFHALQARATAP